MRKKNIYRMAAVSALRRIKEMRQSECYACKTHADMLSELSKLFGHTMNCGNYINAYKNFRGDIESLIPSGVNPSDAQLKRMLDIFANFLRKKRLYTKFMSYQNRGNVPRCCKTISIYTNDIPLWVTACGFIWAHTQQGHAFWRNVSEEWKNICYTHSAMDKQTTDEIRQTT